MVLLDEIEDVSRQNDLQRKVVGVDIKIRPENFKQLQSHPLKHRMELIEGSSVDDEVIQKITKLSEGYKNILVYLDSNHTHEHVLSELEKYTQFVSVGSYCIVFDTVIERLNGNTFPNRPWGRGNNPATAIKEFLYKQDQNKNDQPQFVLDKEIDNKLMISAAYGGWLKRIA